VRAVDLHHVFLVAAFVELGLALEDQPLPIGREICLGVIAAVGQLPDVAEMGLGPQGDDPGIRSGGAARTRRNERGQQDDAVSDGASGPMDSKRRPGSLEANGGGNNRSP
jgi:hypothetical protein